MLRKIKCHHLNNQNQTSQDPKKYHNMYQEQYKTHNMLNKWYKERMYLSINGNHCNGGVVSVLLNQTLKKFTKNRKQAWNGKVQQLM